VGSLPGGVFVTGALLLLLHAGTVAAQEEARLSAGDSIRVDGVMVGTVLNISGPVMTVVTRSAPRCRAGEMHGDAPICDPAPLVRHTMNLEEVTIERRLPKSRLNLRTIAGGVIGGAAFAAAGHAFGPTIGFGRVQGCLVSDSNITCSTGEQRYEPDVLAARQKKSDQEKGMVFFGLIGGTATAILVRKLSVGWVRISPTIAVGGDEPWGLSFTLPASR